MKMFHSKAKYGLVLMLVLSLVLQIAGPIVSQVYANEGIEEVGDGEVNQEVVASQDEGLLEDSQDEKLVKESEEIESQKATDQSLEPEDVEQLAKDKQKPANSDQEEKAQNIEVLKRNQENIINIRPLDAGGGKDLGNIAGFSYTENIYVGGSKEPIKDGDVIELEDLTLLTYRVDFEIPDGYKFNSKDYLNFDLKSLAGIKGININDKDINGRVIFDIANEKIDAAGYKVEGNNLKVTFDHGETINGKRGRKAFVELGFDIKETSEEVEVIEKIELKGKEPKTFFILRNYEGADYLSKNGSYDSKTDEITWIIDINKNLQDLKVVKLTDLIPDGLKVKDIKSYDLEIKLKDNKTIITEKNETTLDLKTNDKNELEIDLGDLARIAKRIKITTTIDGAISGEVTFNNQATIKAQGKGDITVNSKVPINRITDIEKIGKWNESGNKITWTVKFRGDGSTNSYVLKDTPILPENIGIVLVEDSIKLNGIEHSSVDFKLVDNSFEFTNIENTKELQTLEYTTEVIYKDNREGTYTIKNEVEYNGNKTNAELAISRGKMFSKDNGTVYGKENETYVDWEIEINKNNESWKNVKIWEYIPKGFKFISAKNGETKISDEDIEDITNDGVTYKEIKVGDIKEKTTITVTTKLENLDGFNSEEAINKAKVIWKPDISGGIGVGTGDINEYLSEDIEGKFGISKLEHAISKKNNGINYENQTTSWQVNYKTYKETISGFELTDELTKIIGDHKYVKESLKLKLNDVEYSLSIGDNNEIGESGKKINYSLNFDDTNNSFTLKIISADNINVYYNDVALIYNTSFALSKMDDTKDNQSLNKLSNSVKVNNNGKELSTSSEKDVINYISKNGKKEVSKVEGNNRKFNWKVELNHKGKTIKKDKTMVDKLEGKQIYNEESIKVYKAKLDSSGKLERIGEALIKGEDKDYTLAIEKILKSDTQPYDYHSGMEITFKEEVKTPLIIEYQTEAAGPSIEIYKNNIKYNGGKYSDSIKYEKFNDHITKELLNSRDGSVVKGDVLKWKLTVNESLSEIYNYELEDTMSSGLIFIPDSLKIKKGEGDFEHPQNQDFVMTTLPEGKNGFKLTKDFIKEKYIIEYETLVTADVNTESISNSVNIKGEKFEAELEQKSEYKVISRSAAGGSGYNGPDKYKITIIKVDEEDKTIENNEAKFKLITKTNIGKDNPIITEDELTTSNGEVTIYLEKNDYNTYSIKESVAPKGYVTSSKEYKIDFLNANEENVIKLSVTNTKIKGNIEFTKLGEDVIKGLKPIPLEGAEFTLYDESGKNPIKDKDGNNIVATSNSEGRVIFKEIPYGKYTIKESETKVYLPYTKEIKAEIGDDDNGKTLQAVTSEGLNSEDKAIVQNTIIRADIKLNKVDTSDRPLKGAEFTLYDEGGETPIKDKDDKNVVAISNEKGEVVFKNIAYGTYKIKETKAPSGYYSSNKLIKVFVEANGVDVVKDKDGEDLNIKNYRIPSTPLGTLELLKQGEDGENLSGAIFELVQNGLVRYTSKATGKDGRVVFENIPFGKYLVREKQAPEGYKLEKKDIEVDINKTGEVIEVKIINTKLKGSIELKKEDVYGNPLAGAEFALYDSQGQLVGEKVKSNKDGRVRFENVALGDYTIKETKAPDGYKMNDKEFKVSVKEEVTLLKDIEGKELKLANKELGRIKIVKVNKKNSSKFLQGAVFEVRDSKGNLVEELTTNKQGIAIARNLEYGSYKVVETRAPRGYLLDKTEYVVVVNDSNNWKNIEVELIIKNAVDPERPINPDDPGTDEPTGPDNPDEPGYNGPTDPSDPTKPGKPTDPSKPGKPGKPGYNEGDLVQTGTNIDLLIPLGLILILIGAVYIFKNKSIKE